MRECSDDVLLGTIALSTVCSLVPGLFVSRVPGLATEVMDVCPFNDWTMVAECCNYRWVDTENIRYWRGSDV